MRMALVVETLRFSARGCLCMTFLLALCVSLPGAMAEEASELESRFVDLGSADFQVREAATSALLVAPWVTEEVLINQFAHATSLEQRHRLLGIARHMLLRQLRERDFMHHAAIRAKASLGVMHVGYSAETARVAGKSAIEVQQTIPGFPGHEHFKPGDLIVSFNGEPFPERSQRDDFVGRITAQRAGDRVEMEVVRDGEVVVVSVVLASSSALNSMYDNQATGLALRPAYAKPWEALKERLWATVTDVEPADASATR